MSIRCAPSHVDLEQREAVALLTAARLVLAGLPADTHRHETIYRPYMHLLKGYQKLCRRLSLPGEQPPPANAGALTLTPMMYADHYHTHVESARASA